MRLKGMAVIALAMAAPASAQDGGWFGQGGFDSAIFNMQADAMLRRSHQQIFHESVEESLRRPVRPAAPAPAPSPRPAAPPTIVRQIAAELVSGFPAHQRAEAAELFGEMYKRYGLLERHLGIVAGDPAGGLASLTAASYMAFADAEVSDSAFRTLYAQMRGLAAERAEALQQDAQGRVTIAILATYLAAMREALKQQPDARRSAALKTAGGTYLRALLGIDPARVRIGQRGLILR
ncbi:hypothetical protein S2M10_20650 [Sphingomonas sp. S2M10]|uniref:DUF6683 family protein n=1 Tax=Sphingomonas sp. S2M10 TaxID=2705010 RepID=UPI0014566078|nr:DUF6683 family protein [Sphingomonas sp. S2M10]NLS27072.1 hypothetical protein [Sphingomonas sp. S2M10]